MKLGSIRRALVRYFRRGATSVSPQNDQRDPRGYVIVTKPNMFGFLSGEVRYVGPPWSAASAWSPASDPPKASATAATVTPWAEWQGKIDAHFTPSGWTFCKFGVRANPDDGGEVWGIVRDGFGVYWCRFYVSMPEGGTHSEPYLAVAINTRTGYAFGIFDHMQTACEAVEIALRFSARKDLDHSFEAPEAGAAYARLGQVLNAAGYCTGAIVCRPMKGAEPVAGPPIPVWMRGDMSKPEEVRPS